jgi:diguanylate cyclase (GGDEF)-like protein
LFAVVLPVTDREAARAAIDKLRAAVRDAPAGSEWPVTLSIGVVTCEDGGPMTSVDALLEQADTLLYEAKTAGKDAARFARCLA